MCMSVQRQLMWALDELGKDAEMNQRADRLADRGADLGAPSRLALTRFQDRAKLVADGC